MATMERQTGGFPLHWVDSPSTSRQPVLYHGPTPPNGARRPPGPMQGSAILEEGHAASPATNGGLGSNPERGSSLRWSRGGVDRRARRGSVPDRTCREERAGKPIAGERPTRSKSRWPPGDIREGQLEGIPRPPPVRKCRCSPVHAFHPPARKSQRYRFGPGEVVHNPTAVALGDGRRARPGSGLAASAKTTARAGGFAPANARCDRPERSSPPSITCRLAPPGPRCGPAPIREAPTRSATGGRSARRR